MSFNKKLRILAEVGFLTSAKWLRDKFLDPFVPHLHKLCWRKVTKDPNFTGVMAERRDVPLVFSLTTYPERTRFVHEAIESLLMQSCKPDGLLLWLAKSQYPNQEKDLPSNLLTLKKFGLKIKWCEDIKSYKKLVPALREYPKAVIITADDDIYYGRRWAEKLYRAYCADPTKLHCHRVTKFYKDENQWRTISGGYNTYGCATFLHKLTGGAGTCFPPETLPPEVFDSSLFMKLAPTNDDIWFWLMAVHAGLKCNIVKGSEPALHYIAGSQHRTLSQKNDRGENLFWIQFQSVLERYPTIADLLEAEWEYLSSSNST